MDNAAAVFEGRPTGVVRDGMQQRFAFDVTRVWKGNVGPRVEVVTASDSAACGRGYAMGSVYIVYAYRGQDGGLADGLCTRTRERNQALEDLSALGPGVEPGRAVADPSEPTHEPPRIDAPSDDAAPPPSEPNRRGCAVENAHTPSDGALLLLVGAGIAIRRRRIVRSPPPSHS